ncbi:MAG: hypothetical protein ACOYZ8_11565 [Chloroflexota bacterium]
MKRISIFFGSGTQVSDVVRNGIPHTRNLAGYHPAPRKPLLILGHHFLVFAVLVAACSTPQPAAPSVTPASSLTPIPSSTPLPSPTATPPAPEVDPLLWQTYGEPGAEIVTRGVDMTLWAGTDHEQHFSINPEHAAELHDDLNTITLEMWWVEDRAIRARYGGDYEEFVADVQANPVRSDGMLMQPDAQANRNPALVQGYRPVDESGNPYVIDYSRYAVQWVTMEVARAMGEFSRLGGYWFRQEVVQLEDGSHVVKYVLASQYDGSTVHDGYEILFLSEDLTAAENAGAMSQAIRYMASQLSPLDNYDSLAWGGPYWDKKKDSAPLNLEMTDKMKSDWSRAARGAPYFVGE